MRSFKWLVKSTQLYGLYRKWNSIALGMRDQELETRMAGLYWLIEFLPQKRDGRSSTEGFMIKWLEQEAAKFIRSKGLLSNRGR